MKPVDFSIVYDKGDVAIIRNKSIAKKAVVGPEQKIRVQCFSPEQVDRIFRYQEMQNQRNTPEKKKLIERILRLKSVWNTIGR